MEINHKEIKMEKKLQDLLKEALGNERHKGGA